MTDVAGDDDARLLAPPGLDGAGDRPVVAPGNFQTQRRFADGGGSLDQRLRLSGIGPGENRPFFAVDRNDHPVLADQRIAQAGGQGGRRSFVHARMAGQRQLAQQFMRVEFGHVAIGRAAQVDSERGENECGEQREGERQAQRDRVAPAGHAQRISIT